MRSVSITAICLLVAPMALTACGGSGNSIAPKVANCNTTSPASTTRLAASTTRRVRDEMTDSPPWVPDNGTSTNETYADNSTPTRLGDWYDSDLSGAPQHTTYGSGGGGGRNYRADCTQPSSNGRTTQSYGGISYTCWYQARTPGIHNIYDDFFLGCTVDIIGGNNNTPTNNNNSHEGHRGDPVDGATCSGSPMAVGDNISIIGAADTNIADINALWNGNKVAGWMYKGDNGTRFVQMNYSNQAGVSLSVTWGIGTIGVSTPGGYSGVSKWNGGLPPGTRLKKCFNGGSTLA